MRPKTANGKGGTRPDYAPFTVGIVLVNESLTTIPTTPRPETFQRVDAIRTEVKGDFTYVYPTTDEERKLAFWVYAERGHKHIADLESGGMMFFRVR